MLIDLDKFIASMIEAFPAFKEEGRIPCMYKEALEAQGLEYKDGEIVKTQRMVSSDVKEDGCGVSEDERIMEKIIATIHLYYGEPLEDEAKEMIAWLEKQKYKDALTWVKRFYQELSHEHQMEAEALFIAWLEKQGYEPNWCHHKVDLSNCSEEYRKAYYDGWNNCNQQHSQCKSEGNDVVKCLINGMKFYYEDNEEATWGTEKFSMKVKDILSWLEKQGDKSLSEFLSQSHQGTFSPSDTIVNELRRKQAIKDSANNLKSKFKVGDWVVWDNKISCHVDNIYQGKESLMYTITDTNNMIRSYSVKSFDNNARLWSIEDAKDGDILSNGKMIVIFKHFEEPSYRQRIVAYIGLDNNGDIQITDDTWTLGIDKAKPATKEQRDMLFQKMKEAGYEWDAKKKELKKIEQKPTEWSLPYGKNETAEKLIALAECLEMDGDCLFNELSGNDYGKFLRVLAIELTEVKPAEWSEEDDVMVNDILRCLPAKSRPEYNQRRVDWIKSIKSRVQSQPKQEWKQENREELTEFENAMMHIGGSFFGENAGLDPNDTAAIKEQAKLLLELAPKTEWSEEDEDAIGMAIIALEDMYDEDEPNTTYGGYNLPFNKAAERLKSIRNRITLKPSIEQMKILEKVTGVDIEKTLNGFQNFYAHENSGEFPSAIEIAKHFYELGLKASDTELENLLWTLPESIADERSRQVYLMSLYHCDGQCFVDYVGELEEDSLVCFEGETFMEAATKMREWIRKRPKLRKI